VGASYYDFTQTTDDEVRELLQAAWAPRPARPAWQGPSEVVAIRSELSGLSDVDREDLVDFLGEAQFVLLGEASHGTHEFYAERARLTERLIEEKGFDAVAVEADWPDAYQVNRFVRGQSADATAEEALRGFQRFPTWMWRNAVVLDFVGWLREHNDRMADQQAGFYGLDLYSLYRSIHEVISYLERVDPEAANRARARYACFDHFGEDPQAYGYEAAFGAGESCEREVIEQLVDLQEHGVDHARRDGLLAEDDLFYAEQNARTVKAAEE
jgi:erythromycin esterase-like protein